MWYCGGEEADLVGEVRERLDIVFETIFVLMWKKIW